MDLWGESGRGRWGFSIRTHFSPERQLLSANFGKGSCDMLAKSAEATPTRRRAARWLAAASALLLACAGVGLTATAAQASPPSNWSASLDVVPDNPNPGIFDTVSFTVNITALSEIDCIDSQLSVTWQDDWGGSGVLSDPSAGGGNLSYHFTRDPLGNFQSYTFTVTATGGCVTPDSETTPLTASATVSTIFVQYYAYGTTGQWDAGATGWGDFYPIDGVDVALLAADGGPTADPISITTSAAGGHYAIFAPLNDYTDIDRTYKIRFTFPGGTIVYQDASVSPGVASTSDWSSATVGGPALWVNTAYNAYIGRPSTPPVVTPPPTEDPAWTAPSLDLHVGVPFDQTFYPDDVDGWNWDSGGFATLDSGALPDGLQWEEVESWSSGDTPGVRIYGTPTTPGHYEFSLSAWDDYSGYAVADVSGDVLGDSDPGPTDPPVTPAADVTLGIGIGDDVEGAPVTATATGLQDGADYSIVLRSTPITLDAGSAPIGGSLLSTMTIPAGLPAGWHSITLTSTWSTGVAFSKVVWFQVSASGKLVAISSTEPPGDRLAYTGSSTDPTGSVAVAAGLFLLGTLLVLGKRRRALREGR